MHKGFYVAMGALFLVVTQLPLGLALVRANYEAETYKELSQCDSSEFDFLTFKRPLAFEPLNPHYPAGFIQNTTYYMLGYVNRTTLDVFLLEVQFAPDYSEIVDYTLHATPLNSNWTPFTGLTWKDSCFYTLGWDLHTLHETNNDWTHNLIGFTLEGIISNRTLPVPSYVNDPSAPGFGFGSDHRGDIVLVDSTLYVLGRPDYLPHNVTAYDLSTLQEKYTLGVPAEWTYSMGVDEKNTLWVLVADDQIGKNTGSYSFIGYDQNLQGPSNFSSVILLDRHGFPYPPDYYRRFRWSYIQNGIVFSPICMDSSENWRIRGDDLVGFTVMPITKVEIPVQVYFPSAAGIFIFALCVVITLRRYPEVNPAPDENKISPNIPLNPS